MTDERDMLIALSLAAAAHADEDISECRMWLEVALDCCLSWMPEGEREDRMDLKWVSDMVLGRTTMKRPSAEIFTFPIEQTARKQLPTPQVIGS